MKAPLPRLDGTCFYEADPNLSIGRRAFAEAIGSFLLMFTVASAALTWTAGTNAAPIGRALAIGPTLAGLILVFGRVSGGHYNPLISLAQWLSNRRSGTCLIAYVIAQAFGAMLAAWLAVMVWGTPMVKVPDVPPTPLLAAELFATTGLMIIVIAAPRMRPAGVGPFAVGSWIMMTIVGLPSRPDANPVITIAALMSGLAPLTTAALYHLIAQAAGLAGAMLAMAITAASTSSDDLDHA